MADGYLNFDTKVDTQGFNKGTKSITNSLGGLKSALGKVAVAAAAAFSVKKLVDFGKSAVDLASDLQEVQNVVDTAFGDMSYKMEEFANTAVEQFGISRLTAKQTGSTFMAMASGMGVASDDASDMSIALTGLSADMASFYNVEQNVASTALKSVFTGETETLKQFGIVMTQANLETFALEQGITKSYQAMTQAEKVQLRYAYVMQSTALAQGDFAKTSDGWANQTRILSEKWKEFSATVGTVLMNVLIPAVRTLNNAMTSLISSAQKVADALSSVFGISEQTSTTAGLLADSSGAAAESYDAMAESAENAQKANDKSLASFDKINKLGGDSGESSGSADSSTSIAGTSPTISPDVDTSQADSKLTSFIERVKGAFDKVSTIVKNIGSNIKAAFSADNVGLNIINNLFGTFESIGKTVSNITDDIVEWSAGLDFGPIAQSLKSITDQFKPMADSLGGMLETAVSRIVLPSIKFNLEELSPAAFEAVASALEVINAILQPIANTFDYIIAKTQPFVSLVQDVLLLALNKVSEIFGAIAAKINEHAPQIQTVIQGVADVIGLVGNYLKTTLLPPLTLAFEFIKQGILGVIDQFLRIIDILASVIDFIKAVFKGDWKAAWQAIKDLFTALFINPIINGFERIKSVAKAVGTFLKTIFQNAWNAIKNAWNGVVSWFGKVWSGIKSVFSTVGKWFSDIFGKAWNGIKSIFDNAGTAFTNVWNAIKKPFETIATWFKDKFTAAWTAVKNVFSSGGKVFDGIKDGILDGLKAVINALIRGINKVIALPFKGINKALDKIHNIEILGKKPFDFIKTIDIPEIPQLAKGAVIPPNSEFLAVLGDQKRGVNIETPLATMIDAFKAALRDMGSSDGEITINNKLVLDGKDIYSAVVRENRRNTRVTGKNALAY